MCAVDTLKKAYLDYIATANVIIRDSSVTDGLFGFGKSPKSDPCHEKFFEQIGKLTKDLSSGNLTSTEAAECVRWILTADRLPDVPQASYWMLLAAQYHAIPLIPFLSSEDAKTLCREYNAAFPRFQRLPKQEEVMNALKKQRRAG